MLMVGLTLITVTVLVFVVRQHELMAEKLRVRADNDSHDGRRNR